MGAHGVAFWTILGAIFDQGSSKNAKGAQREPKVMKKRYLKMGAKIQCRNGSGKYAKRV